MSCACIYILKVVGVFKCSIKQIQQWIYIEPEITQPYEPILVNTAQGTEPTSEGTSNVKAEQ